jgi:hypothetical protein
MKKWLEWIGIGLVAIVLLFSVVTYVRFSQWRNAVTKNLKRDSVVVQTAKGPIEYAEVGHGPVVLMVHGDPGGYDQIYQVLKIDDAEHGDFRYVIPSRPGYLRTPLIVGKTPKEQAEAFAALLDALKIDKVSRRRFSTRRSQPRAARPVTITTLRSGRLFRNCRSKVFAVRRSFCRAPLT